MYELIIIACLAIIFGILLRKWPLTATIPEISPTVTETQPKLSDINFLEEGERLFQKKRYKEAEKYFVKAIAGEPKNHLIYGRLGVIYTELGNLQDAKEAFATAVKLAPENGLYQNNLGLILYKLGRYKESVIYFENAVKIAPNIAKRWFNLGLAYQKIGESKKAKKAFKEYKKYLAK